MYLRQMSKADFGKASVRRDIAIDDFTGADHSKWLATEILVSTQVEEFRNGMHETFEGAFRVEMNIVKVAARKLDGERDRVSTRAFLVGHRRGLWHFIPLGGSCPRRRRSLRQGS